jgi:heme/copper-type cytochrome/quinol oxidase subunit 4
MWRYEKYRLSGYKRIGIVLSLIWTVIALILAASGEFNIPVRPENTWGSFKLVAEIQPDGHIVNVPQLGKVVFPRGMVESEIDSAIKNGKRPRYVLTSDEYDEPAKSHGAVDGPWNRYSKTASSEKTDVLQPKEGTQAILYEYIQPDNVSRFVLSSAVSLLAVWLSGITLYWLSHFTIAWVIAGFRNPNA